MMNDLIKKFRTKQDRINFCRESGLYMPDAPGFDTKFFIQFLQGKKKLLPLGGVDGYSFNYFTKNHRFTKAHLWEYFKNDQELLSYVPDEATSSSLARNLLFSILATAKKEVYLELYNEYKIITSSVNNSRWDTYGVETSKNMIDKINEFNGSFAASRQKPFRLSKGGQKINEISEVNADDNSMG